MHLKDAHVGEMRRSPDLPIELKNVLRQDVVQMSFHAFVSHRALDVLHL